MTFSTLAAWTLTAMVRMQDPNGPGVDPALAASYPETAVEIADAAEANPLYDDAQNTAALLVVWAYHESRFRRAALGDSGASRGLLQVSRVWGEPTVEKALAIMHLSFRICRDRPLKERAAWYASGGPATCDRRLELSRSRMSAAAKLLREVRP